jgi:hypothetical protein
VHIDANRHTACSKQLEGKRDTEALDRVTVNHVDGCALPDQRADKLRIGADFVAPAVVTRLVGVAAAS